MPPRHLPTMENLKGVIDYIRSFFTSPLEVPRKRRAPETWDSFMSPKQRKITPTMSRQGDDWPFLHGARQSSSKIFPRQSRPIDTIVLDDEDDLKHPPLRPNRSGTKFTSTPANSRMRPAEYTNGTEDEEIQFVSEEKGFRDKKIQASQAGLNYLSTFSTNLPVRNIKSSPIVQQNGAMPKKSLSGTNILNSSKCDASKNSTREYSFRLDDKMQYKKLLENVGNLTSDSSGSAYYTPIGKLFSSSNGRSAKLLTLANKSCEKKERERVQRRLSTKDKIIKVLDDFETEPVIVRDSESEDDVIVCPPSPKPDIKVDPINSLKKVVDCNEHTKSDWLTEIVERHKKNIAQREKEIKEFKENCDSYGSINRDIQRLHLTKKINESLSLREAVFPVEESEEEFVFPELTDEHLRLVKKAFSGDPNEILAKKFNLNITRRDILTLAGLNWLNDEVINFYMNLIAERSKECPNLLKTYCFNTFFFPKIIKDGPSAVRRWTKRVDLFSYDIICVPIHLGMHWCMSIINLSQKSIQYYDSMGSTNKKCLEALRNYLEVEHMDKKGSTYDTSDFVLENVKDIPQQMNGSDCGMFSCTFAEFLSRNAKIAFSQEDMPYLRKKMVVEILTGDLLIK